MARSRSLAPLAALLLPLAVPLGVSSCGRPVAATPDPIIVSVDPSIGSPGPQFRPRLGEHVGHHPRLLPLRVASSRTPGGGLLVDVVFEGGFSSLGAHLALEHGTAGAIRCAAVVSVTTDVDPPGSTTHTCRGRVWLSRGDWESITPETPLYVKFEFADAVAEGQGTLDGYVKLPD